MDLETERYFRQNEIVITSQLGNIKLLSSAEEEDHEDGHRVVTTSAVVEGESHGKIHHQGYSDEEDVLMERRSNGSMASALSGSDHHKVQTKRSLYKSSFQSFVGLGDANCPHFIVIISRISRAVITIRYNIDLAMNNKAWRNILCV